MSGTGDLQKLAERSVEHLKAKGAKDAAAVIGRGRSVELEIREKKVEKLQESAAASLSVAVYADGRYSGHSTNDLRWEKVSRFLDDALAHCAAGIGAWDWASNTQGGEPDLVMACAGDVPTIETLAAVDLLRRLAPELRVRVVNVVDLMTLQPDTEHPHGLPDRDFDALFTKDKPVIFAYHGYPWLIHRLTYRRANHDNLHVRGYKEEGTTTTPFDMVVLNDLDRFHLVIDAAARVPALADKAGELTRRMQDKRAEHKRYIERHGEDMPEIRHWKWPYARHPQ